MIMKKFTAYFLCLFLCLSLAACGNEKEEDSEKSSSRIKSEVNDTPDEEKNDASEEESGADDSSKSDPAEESSDDSSESDPAEESSEASATFEIPVQTDFVAVEGLGDKYVDFDNRAFAYDGKVFKLGESTLKDLIDGGIPFEENDLNNRGNNVNKNYQTGRYNAPINDYVNLQCTFINTTKGPQKEEECLLYSVRYYYLYVPQPDYEPDRNEKLTKCILDASKKVCFSFPATLTKEQLLENSSEGAELDDNFNCVKYNVKSEVYMGSSGYSFRFNKVTNQLQEVSIDWLP